MHAGVAVLAEGDEVLGPVVGIVAVDMVDVQLFRPSADDATVPVAFEDGLPGFFPTTESVLVPCRNAHAVEPAEERGFRPVGEGAPVAELPKAVPVGVAPAERSGARIERTEIQLYLTHAGSISAAGVKKYLLPEERTPRMA